MIASLGFRWSFKLQRVTLSILTNLQNILLPVSSKSPLSSPAAPGECRSQTCLLPHKADLWAPELNTIAKWKVLQDNTLRNSAELASCYSLLFKQPFSLCLDNWKLSLNSQAWGEATYLQGPRKCHYPHSTHKCIWISHGNNEKLLPLASF